MALDQILYLLRCWQSALWTFVPFDEVSLFQHVRDRHLAINIEVKPRDSSFVTMW